MRFRLFICFMGTLLLPSASNALLVSDLPGTSQAMTEATNTMNNWKESISQTAAIQKTVSAVGTAKKGLTTAMNAIKDFQEKVEFYQAQVAEAQAYVQSTMNDVKGAVDTVKNADKIAKGLADRAVNSVKDTAMSTVNSVKGTVDSVKDTALSAKDQAVGIGEMAKDTAGIKDKNTGGSDSGTETGTENETAENNDVGTVSGNGGGSGATAGAADIVDTPSATPSRRAISTGTSSAVAAVSGGGTVSAGGSVMSSSGGAVQKAVSAAPSVISASAAGTAGQAATAPQTVKALSSAAVQTAGKIELARPATEKNATARVSEVKELAETLKTSVSKAMQTSDIQAAGTEKTETLAPVENGQILKTQETLQSKSADMRQNAKEALSLQNTTVKKAVKTDAAKKELKQDIQAVSAQAKTSVQKLKTPVKKIDNLQLKQVAPQIEKEKNTRPVRASFKTSSGYGQIKTSTPLAFAQMSLKGGTAMGNIMIVPRDIFARCKLDYEQAAEKGKYDECLKKINDIRMSEVSKKVTKDMIDKATEDLYNGYAEMLASGFLEAFEVYNDSVDFYHKQIHPNQEVNAQRIADVSEGWALSKDMNGLLDGRLNELNKLWGRQLLTKGVESYIFSGIKTSEDTGDKKKPLNTNMYGKVIISSVLVDRCGVSVTNPEISEDCLKTLATDLKTNAEDTDYGSWQEERGLIVNEYASAYNERAAKALAAVGDNFKNIADLTGMDLSGAGNLTEPDILDKITDNNAVANQVAAKILDALDLRASAIMLDSINRMLTELVPALNKDDATL